jgi:hypothetical protein
MRLRSQIVFIRQRSRQRVPVARQCEGGMPCAWEEVVLLRLIRPTLRAFKDGTVTPTQAAVKLAPFLLVFGGPYGFDPPGPYQSEELTREISELAAPWPDRDQDRATQRGRGSCALACRSLRRTGPTDRLWKSRPYVMFDIVVNSRTRFHATEWPGSSVGRAYD